MAKDLLKILFIEDLPSDVELAVIELKREKLKFDFTSVCTKEDLLKVLEQYKPDLIISDYMMPEFNGLQALQLVKKISPEIPFIIFTGSVNEETAVECLKSGAIDYVIKEHIKRLPFAVIEALDKVRVLREKKEFDILLKESEAKLQSIFRAAPVGIGLVANRIIIEVNDTLCNLIGYKRNELIGKSSLMLYPTKEEYEIAGENKYKQIEEKGTGSVETLFKCKDGKILNVYLSSTPLDKNNLSKGVTFTVLDITARKKAENELRESHRSLNTLISNLQGMVYRCKNDKKWTMEFLSEGTRDLTGYSPEGLVFNKNISFNDLIHPDDRELVWNGVQAALKSKSHYQFTYRIRNIKGEIRWVWEKGEGVFSSSGELEFLEGFITDITQRKKIEDALRLSEEKFRSIAESLSDLIFITDTEGFIKYVSPSSISFGYQPEELTGRFFGEFLPDEEKEKAMQIFINANNAVNTETSVSLIFNRKDGSSFFAELTGSVFKIGDEKIGVLGLLRDVTQRKILEAATIENEKRYRELFLNNPIPTYIFDENSLEFIEVNDATVENYGYTRKEFATMTLKDIRPPEDVPELLNSIQFMGEEVFHSSSMRHRRKNGTVFPVELTSHSLPEKNGRKTRLVVVFDITERVKAADILRLAKENAEASDKLKTSFLNNISHEVRTPLNGILGFADILSKPDLSDEDRAMAYSVLYASNDRLLETITNYMDISLITSGNMTIYNKEFMPFRIMSELYNKFNPVCNEKHINLSFVIPHDADKLLINSDPEKITKIFSHLLSNALKFTEKGNISFGYLIKNNTIEFFVSDTGIGIRKESVEQIFGLFVKEDHGPLRLTEGSGLGLSISKGLIKLLGGDIRVESEEGEGSKFYFSLPYLRESVSLKNSDDSKNLKKSLKNNLVLVAEDDQSSFQYIKTILNRETPATIIHATNGREAIEMFTGNPGIVLVLMDIKMPEIDGLKATQEIKQIRKEIPVIAITAYAMSGDKEAALNAGCDGYLSKPLNKQNLIDKISEFVNI